MHILKTFKIFLNVFKIFKTFLKMLVESLHK